MTNGYSASFLRFYKVYPKKKGKFEANKHWKKFKLDKIEKEIISHVEMSVKYDTDWKLGRIPYASTYIYQRRWEDEISGCYREPQTDDCKTKIVKPIPKIPQKTVETLEIKKCKFELRALFVDKPNWKNRDEVTKYVERVKRKNMELKKLEKDINVHKLGDTL